MFIEADILTMLERIYKRVIIWGSLPNPFGGVSVHVLRLIEALKEFNNVELVNFSSERPIIERPNIRSSKGIFKEFVSVLLKKKILIHLHTNRLIVLYLFSLFKREQFIVTLHNKRFLKFRMIERNIFIYSLKKAYCVFSNDVEVQSFLKEYNIQIINAPAFLPPCDIEYQKGVINEAFLSFRKRYPLVFSMSVFGFNYLEEDDYGIKSLLYLMQEIENKDWGICLCVSQPNKRDLAVFQKQLISSRLDDRVLFLINEITNGSVIWKQSDGFLRLNNTDIEGLSVKEALILNTPVLASNICSRPQDAIVYSTNSYEDLRRKFLYLIEQNSFLKEKLIQSSKKDIINAIDVIKPVYKKILR